MPEQRRPYYGLREAAGFHRGAPPSPAYSPKISNRNGLGPDSGQNPRILKPFGVSAAGSLNGERPGLEPGLFCLISLR